MADLEEPHSCDVLDLEYSELRELDLEDLVEVLELLGITHDGVENRNQALTLLVEHAV